MSVTDTERAVMDKMIAEAKRGRREKRGGVVKITRYLDYPDMVYAWTIGDEIQGVIGRRDNSDEKGNAEFGAELAKYFADGVNPTSITLKTPSGEVERLK